MLIFFLLRHIRRLFEMMFVSHHCVLLQINESIIKPIKKWLLQSLKSKMLPFFTKVCELI